MQPVRYQVRFVIAAYITALGTYSWFTSDELLSSMLSYLMLLAGILIARDAWADRRAQRAASTPAQDTPEQGVER